MREEGKHKSRGSQKWKWARVVQHRRKCIDLRAGVKAKAKSNIGNSHRDRHRAGTRTKAEANSGDSKTVVRTKAENDSGDSKTNGDSHQDDHRAGVRTKAENDSGDSKTNGNSHQDGLKHHKKISHTFRVTPRSTMKKSPAERLYGRRFNTRLLGGGKTKAETNGDSHQDDHRAGGRTKADTNIGDSLHWDSHQGDTCHDRTTSRSATGTTRCMRCNSSKGARDTTGKGPGKGGSRSKAGRRV